MSPSLPFTLAVTSVALLAGGCGHPPAGKAADPGARTLSTADQPALADAEPAVEPAGGPTAARVSAAVPATDGCTFTAAPGVTEPAGITIVGVGDGGGGYDMPDICPRQACSAGYTIDLPRARDWSDGVYTFVVATDRGTLACRETAVTPPPRPRPASCAHARELTPDCAGPQPFSAGPIMISGRPTTIQVTIAQDGQVLADQVVDPWYSAKRWDGFDCDPSCGAGSHDVPVR